MKIKSVEIRGARKLKGIRSLKQVIKEYRYPRKKKAFEFANISKREKSRELVHAKFNRLRYANSKNLISDIMCGLIIRVYLVVIIHLLKLFETIS